MTATASYVKSRRIFPTAGLRVGRVSTILAGAFMILLVAFSFLAPLIWPFGPNDQDLTRTLLPPLPFAGSEAAHLLGTDSLGRDMVARLAAGARTSLGISAAGVAIAGVFGIVVGMIAGYLRGIVDFLVNVLIEVQVSFPGLLMAVLFLALVGGSGPALIAFLAISGWMVFARTARAGVFGENSKEYVRAAIAIGASSPRVLFRHIGPNLLPSFGVIAGLEIAQNMLAESALSFLGLGIKAPAVSWGLMLEEGKARMGDAWWLISLPGLAIMVAVLSIVTLTEAARRRMQ
jgi:peptide/nickel transport system permease protein